jgi:hypothetical protein
MMFHVSADSTVMRPFAIVKQSASSRASRYVASRVVEHGLANLLSLLRFVVVSLRGHRDAHLIFGRADMFLSTAERHRVSVQRASPAGLSWFATRVSD